MSLIEKIDAEIAVYKEKQNNSDCAGSISYQNIINGLNDAKQIILAGQKEPCEFCKPKFAKRMIGKYCSNCGRAINEPQEPKSIILTSKSTLFDKPLTKGDKIREDNESLSAFIRGQFGDDRVFHNGNTVDLDDYLNQPQEGE